jgi:hypothetical protein
MFFWTRRRFRLHYFTLPILLKNEKKEKRKKKKEKRDRKIFRNFDRFLPAQCLIIAVVEPGGFEPPTLGLQSRCSPS